ncbi:MAG: NAD(P)H-dependent glycerol-3-phosphate dehydrogenase [Planctomycetota bacterium]
MSLAIIGGGNFGTAVANIAAGAGTDVALWMRDPEQVQDTLEHRENRRYLPGHALDDRVTPTNDLAGAVAGAQLIIVTVPSASFRAVSRELAPHVGTESLLVSGTKGIEGDGFVLMSQILRDETGSQHVGALSGPNLAEEMADGHYTGSVIASDSARVRETATGLIHSGTFRVYESDDPFGVELAGSLKNIYAIICGLAAGLEVGQNTVAMLVTRGLAEMSRFAVSMGANPFTFLGLAGVGDLMATCTSPYSRNYRLGQKLATGMSLDQAVEELGKLAEGVNTTRVVVEKSEELDVYMPLARGLHQLAFEGQPISSVISALVTSEHGYDVEFARP